MITPQNKPKKEAMKFNTYVPEDIVYRESALNTVRQCGTDWMLSWKHVILVIKFYWQGEADVITSIFFFVKCSNSTNPQTKLTNENLQKKND